MIETFYKLAKPDGWDFYTGRTINYRDKIGKIVKRPKIGTLRLCSDTCIHASRDPNYAFIGAKIPCSVYLVEGVPIKEDKNKVGFKQLGILEELDPEKVFKWKYKDACNPIHPFKIEHPLIDDTHLKLVKDWDSARNLVRDSVRDSVGVSVWDSVGVSVWDSVGVSVWDSVRDSVWDSVWGSVWDSVWAYCGWIFSSYIKRWKHINHKPGLYPFQSVIDLWLQGLVPSFDGKIWRLHGGKEGKILWEGKSK